MGKINCIGILTSGGDAPGMNAAILAVQMLALSDTELAAKFADYKTGLKKKIVKANEELKEVKFEYKTN